MPAAALRWTLTPIALGLILCASCGTPSPARDSNAGLEGKPRVLDLRAETIKGRPFMLSVAEFELPESLDPRSPNKTHTVLYVEDDRWRISFASSTGPYNAKVKDERIEFGGHTIGVTAKPGTYLIDSRRYELPETGLNVFDDGGFVETQRGP